MAAGGSVRLRPLRTYPISTWRRSASFEQSREDIKITYNRRATIDAAGFRYIHNAKILVAFAALPSSIPHRNSKDRHKPRRNGKYEGWFRADLFQGCFEFFVSSWFEHLYQCYEADLDRLRPYQNRLTESVLIQYNQN